MDDLPERFWAKVEERSGPLDTPCWHWNAAHHAHGYGTFKVSTKTTVRVHALTYALFIGPPPERSTGLVLDHLCRNRRCCNPWHLDVVTHRVNILRGNGWCAEQARKTHCVNGHEFTPENTSARNDNRKHGGRRCKQCQRDAVRRYLARKALA